MRSLRIEGEEPVIALSDGREEPLDAETVTLGDGEALYVRVKDRAFRGAFYPDRTDRARALLVESASGEPELQVHGRRYGVAARASRNSALRVE